ncbi:tetratricopeptide repeat-containing sensor histidine kinase [Flavobacterium sp. TMP13]|uniref:tetratricopeptide repeat-containing sensor histidine kinase n=1 Tax=Flavobacterium sp. TMP13 TaxID=3425950 RepID=UPI003D7875C4
MRVAPIFFLYLLFISQLLLSCNGDSEKLPVSNEAVASKELLALIQIGDSLYDSQKFDSSYYYFTKAKSIALNEKNIKKIVYCIFNMADINQKQGDYISSESAATEALPYLKEIKNPNYAWNIYVILGVNYLHKYDYNKSLLYYEKAYQLKTDKLRKLNTQNNKAVVYMEQGSYDSAIEIFDYLCVQNEIQTDPESYARILNNLGLCHEANDPKKALSYYRRCFNIYKSTNNEWGLIGNYVNQSKHFQKTNRKLSKHYASKAYELATKWNSSNDRMNALIALIHSSTGTDLKKYSLKYVALNDSITKQKQIAKNQFAKVKYDSSLAKRENEILKSQKITAQLELEQEKYKKLLSYLLITLVLIISIVIYYYLLYRSKIEKSKAIYKSETRISKKLHDELANEIYQTITMVESKNLAYKENKEELLNNLDIIYSQIRNISYQNRIINTDETFAEFLKQMINTYNSSAIQIIMKDLNVINWNNISAAQKITVYRVLQELLVNMKKHSQSSFVVISFTSLATEIQIDYSDNGIGINPEKISSKNGLKNAENRLKSIKGSLSYSSILDKGFKASITFPTT